MVLPTVVPGEQLPLIHVVERDDLHLAAQADVLWFRVLRDLDWRLFLDVACGYHEALYRFNEEQARRRSAQDEPPNPETERDAQLRLIAARPTEGGTRPILVERPLPPVIAHVRPESIRPGVVPLRLAGRQPKCFTDTRKRPRIALERAVKPLFLMTLARMGSLNALEQTAASRVWRECADGDPPSADTLARLVSRVEIDEVRRVVFVHYEKLKRNKALRPPWHGLMALVLDGHESTASYRRTCTGCLTRNVHTAQGDRQQHYHRYVAASLVGEDFHVFLDIEDQLPGENELAPALRLLERVHQRYPRAFDVVIADAFYAQAPFFQAVLAMGKDPLVVLKQEVRDLYQDALALCAASEPATLQRGKASVCAWDLGDLTTWPSLGRPVRVVRTIETTRIRRQATEEEEELRSEWMWVTTLPPARAPTRAVLDLGHSRWDIENRGFNEGANDAHLDHVYHHEPVAMRVLILLTMLAMNVLHAFFRLNIKPAVRRRNTLRHVAELIRSAIYAALPRPRGISSA